MAENTEIREALEGMVCQHCGIVAGKWHSMGISANEIALEALGWDNAPEDLLCQHSGCGDRSTCGTPTPQGYKRLCGKHLGHYRAWRNQSDGR